MPHPRQRHARALLLKKLKYAPVVALQGVRQCGKSFLVRELLTGAVPNLVYKSFDQASIRNMAELNAEVFLGQNADARPLVIDEAQRVPGIFEAVKFQVDQRRIPGQFMLLGSTEFSHLTKIRESLTGRMSRMRLYPLTLSECLGKPLNVVKKAPFLNTNPRVSRLQMSQHLVRGGMPGIFACRSGEERNGQMTDWLELTLKRDLFQIKGYDPDPALAERILECIARLEEPTLSNIAVRMRVDLRRLKKHLLALQELFVIHALPSHPTGTGKPIYFMCDVSFATHLGANLEKQLYTWLVQEVMAQSAYRNGAKTRFYYYRSLRGSIIHLVIEMNGNELIPVRLLPEERLDERELLILYSFRTKFMGRKSLVYALSAERQSQKRDGLEIFPWESLA